MGKRRTLVLDGYNPIKIFPDGDQWCALVGENLQEGICAFGSTPEEALLQLLPLISNPCGDNHWVITE